MPFPAIDPSLAVGFLLQTRADFDRFVKWHKTLQEKDSSSVIFTVQDVTPDYLLNSNSNSSRISSSFSSAPKMSPYVQSSIVTSSSSTPVTVPSLSAST